MNIQIIWFHSWVDGMSQKTMQKLTLSAAFKLTRLDISQLQNVPIFANSLREVHQKFTLLNHHYER